MNELSIGVYRKSARYASLVFKTKRFLYRFATVEPGAALLQRLCAYKDGLMRGIAEQRFVMVICCGGGRRHVLEIGLVGGLVTLFLYELFNGGMVLRFRWRGAGGQLLVLSPFR